jgi:CRISPR-associated exonuclease Cas4
MQSFEGESESIPVSALRQFSFCPRTVFFSEVRDLRPVCGDWVENGTDFHAREEMLIRRRNLEGLGIPLGSELRTELRLKSVMLGLHGICDAAYFFTDEEGRQRAVPLEFKSSERLRFAAGAELQTAAYAMILAEQYGCTADRGFILYGGKGRTLTVNVDAEMKRRVMDTVRAIREALRLPVIPDSSADESQCSTCEYINFCADRY